MVEEYKEKEKALKEVKACMARQKKTNQCTKQVHKTIKPAGNLKKTKNYQNKKINMKKKFKRTKEQSRIREHEKKKCSRTGIKCIYKKSKYENVTKELTEIRTEKFEKPLAVLMVASLGITF